MRRLLAIAIYGCASLVFAKDEQEAIDVVRKHVESLPNGANAATFQAPSGDLLKSAFPDERFVIVRFRIFPIARVMPEGMQPSNIFVVDKAGKLDHLKDVKSLEAFFRNRLVPVKSADDAKRALAAWLALSPEYHQDGMFKFETLTKEFAGDASKVNGRAIVAQGGNGEVRAELTFDRDGKLQKADQKAMLRSGPRPICQATKLLDSDPIVRRMAEADLVIMGVAARDYLMEQRERAVPELRDAIDRLWKRIETNGW